MCVGGASVNPKGMWQETPVCQAGCTWRVCAGGSTCDTPGDAPSSVQAQPQPSSLSCDSRPQVCRHAGRGAGPLRLRAGALGFARPEAPPPGDNLRQLALPEDRRALPPMSPPRGRADPGPTRGRGRTGRSPCGDVGSLSRCVSLATAFPSQVSGGPPPPIQLFPQWGVVRGGGAEGSEEPTPPLCEFGCLCWPEPRFTSAYLPCALGLYSGTG